MWRSLAMPFTFRSSMPMALNVLASRVVSLCAASVRTLAMRAWMRARRAFCLRQLAENRRLRASALLARRSRFRATEWLFGPVMNSPVESAANVLTPRSTPTTGSCWSTGFTSSVSIMIEANQRSPSRETVTRFRRPENRTASRILIQAMTGSLMRLPSVRNVPASLAAQNLALPSLRLNRG